MNTKASILLMLLLTALNISACTGGKGDAPANEANRSIEIVAHRGDSYYAPENTLAAVNSAWEKDADAVEVDVYLTSDDRVVAIHDATTKRTGDMNLKVKESTAEELRKVDVGSFKGEEFAGEQIPFLEDIVASIPAGKKLFIEIKDDVEIMPYVRDIVEASDKKDRVVVIAFDLDNAVKSKELMPEVPAYWLHSVPRDDEGNALPIPLEIIATAKEKGLDGVDINHRGLTEEFVKECRRLDQGIYVWTVNDTTDIQRVVDLGVDGITTDRIDNVQKVLGR